MRLRFFVIILVVLVAVALGSTLMHGFFLRQEKLGLIDQQVRETATALLTSDLGITVKVDIDRVESIISEELGENRIGKFFIIRNQQGEVIFESTSARVLPVKEVPQDPQWITIRGKGQYIRVLNLQLPRIPDRTLQVGLVIDEDLLATSFFSRTSITFAASIVFMGLLMAWFLTSTLLRPIHRLERFVSDVANQATTVTELPALPPEIRSLNPDHSGSRDELARLVSGFEILIDRVNRGYRLSRFWSYQMAHELKTPLTILGVDLEKARSQGEIESELAESFAIELSHMSEIITSFLSWAEIENSSLQKKLHVVSVAKLIGDLGARLNRRYPDRLILEVSEDFLVLGNLQHIEMAVLNVLQNALMYSPPCGRVHVQMDRRELRIQDEGPGLPVKVLERLGDPFNRGESGDTSVKGHGLGLAFVMSISRLYGWKMEIATGDQGSTVCIGFPEIDEEPTPSIAVRQA